MKNFVLHQVVQLILGIIIWISGVIFAISGIGFIVTWVMELPDKMEIFKQVAIYGGIVWIVAVLLIFVNLIILAFRAVK